MLEREDLSRVKGIIRRGKKPFNLDRTLEIIAQEKKKYRFVTCTFSDNANGRCVLGLLLSHYGWDGKRTGDKEHIDMYWRKMMNSLGANNHADFMAKMTEFNDTSDSWEEVQQKIGDYLEQGEHVIANCSKNVVPLNANHFRLVPMLRYRFGSYGVYQNVAILLKPGKVAKAFVDNFCLYYKNMTSKPVHIYGWFFDPIEDSKKK